MAKKLVLLFLISSLTVLCLLSYAFHLSEKPHSTPPLLSSLSGKNSPIWWEIKLLLISKGNYRVEEGNSSYPGSYSFIILWTGCMERDNGDFLLYRENFELLQWKAQEAAFLPDSLSMLSTDDFISRPFFNLNYILRKGEILIFDFGVEGFIIPQNESSRKFYLSLPVSEENSQYLSKINYNNFVYKGSNHISLKEKEIYLNPVKKKFNWKWKYQEWPIDSQEKVRFSHRHDVKVEISITPHFEKSKNKQREEAAFLRK